MMTLRRTPSMILAVFPLANLLQQIFGDFPLRLCIVRRSDSMSEGPRSSASIIVSRESTFGKGVMAWLGALDDLDHITIWAGKRCSDGQRS